MVSLADSRLNLYRHFGDSAANENNTTRALLIALSRSPWSLALFRSFLDLIDRKLEPDDTEFAEARRFLRQQPAAPEFRMQVATASEQFVPEGITAGLLIDLTPVKPADSNSSAETQPRSPSGIADAIITLRGEEEDGIVLVLENKLFGAVAESQLATYENAFKERGVTPRRVSLQWQEIYGLVAALPRESEHDPIIRDFREFLERDTNLTGFVGFRHEHFQTDSADLPATLAKFSARLLDRMTSPALPFARMFSEIEKKRGDLDYDFSSTSLSTPGNLGVAVWDPAEGLSAKLVIGWRTRWQIDAIKGNAGLSETLRHLQVLEEKHRDRIRLAVAARPFFHRFDYASAARWKFSSSPQASILGAWNRVWDYISRQHGRPLLNDADLSIPPPEPNERLQRARAAQCKVFTPLVVTIQWPPQSFSELKPDAQIDTVAAGLEDLAGLLQSLQGGTPAA